MKDKKRILIVGTSHSQSTCRRTADSDIEIIKANRWHDYFKTQLGYEVLNISHSACSPHQQLYVLQDYMHNNPGETFDLAILEGRVIESNFNVPFDQYADFSQGIPAWQHWSSDDVAFQSEHKGQLPISRIQAQDFSKGKKFKYHRYAPFFVDYSSSMQHAIDTFSCNYAICQYMATFSKHVRFVSWGGNPDTGTELLEFGHRLLKDFLFTSADDNHWPSIDWDKFNISDSHYCHCGHLNILGNSAAWHSVILPEVESIFNV